MVRVGVLERLFLGFRVPPVVKWDIELSLFRAHIELPDSIEDDWLASELSSRLAQYTLESPLSVSLTTAQRRQREPDEADLPRRPRGDRGGGDGGPRAQGGGECCRP